MCYKHIIYIKYILYYVYRVYKGINTLQDEKSISWEQK